MVKLGGAVSPLEVCLIGRAQNSGHKEGLGWGGALLLSMV